MNTAKKDIESTPDVGAVGIESTALFAVRVLTHRGHNDTAEEYTVDADLIPHLREISTRYSELKRTHDFMSSARIAKAEWLTRFLSANTNHEPTAPAAQPKPDAPQRLAL